MKSDNRFILLDTFLLKVTKGYRHTNQLEIFRKENRGKFNFYNDDITDANFAKVTNKLIPGKTYTVKIFGIRSGKVIWAPDCLAFLRTQSAILVGAQGISIVWQQAKEKFPKGKWMVSFDEEEALWRDADGNLRVPFVRRASEGGFDFSAINFDLGWDHVCCLLCFCDE